ncbi:MAG TPA: hypothetical protein PKK10_17830, partial [Woeseiaceae bacterium]|nr:hypothetical protein [Woeseiaceae bacterium]
RLRQRVRGRVELSALDARETGIYLAHCFAPTGRPFATLFAPGSAELLFDLSSGTPRLLNVLVESVLAAAMQLECDEIDLPLIQKVAETEHGLTASKAPAPEKTPAAAEVAAEPSVGGSNTITTRSLVVDSAGAANQRPRLDTTLPDLDELAPELAGGKRRDPVKALPQQPPPTSRSNEPMSAAPPRTADAGPSRSQFDQPAAMHADDDAIPTLFSSARMVAPTRADNLREPTVTPEVPAAPPAPTAQAKPPGVAKTVSAAGTATDAAPPDAQQPQQTADEQHPDTDPPAWDRDPTLAELRPDLEALELALAQSTDPEPERKAVPTEPDPVVELKEPTFYGVPEITLDVAIQQKISEATEALKKHDATIAEEDFDSAPKARDVAQNKPARTETKPAPQGAPKVAPEVAAKAAPKPAAMAAEKPATKAATEPKSAPLPKQKPPASAPARNSDFDELAAGIANARTLEDVDDRMAETLFGEEFSAIAAQVVAQVAANAPDSGDSYDDSGSLELELVNDESDDAQDDPGETEFEREFKNVYGEKALEVSLQSDVPRAGLDLSASQRLATVRALNANRGHAAAAATRSAPHAKGSTPTRSQPQAAPQPIEEQISTSMTQTLRALNARPKPANDDDDDAPKSGFFSRFKRS